MNSGPARIRLQLLPEAIVRSWGRCVLSLVVCVFLWLVSVGSVRGEFSYTIDFETDTDGVTTPADDAVVGINYWLTTNSSIAGFTYQDLEIKILGGYGDTNSHNTALKFEDYFVSQASATAYGYTVNEETIETENGFASSVGNDSPAAGYEQQAGNFMARENAPSILISVASSGSLVSAASGQIWDIDSDWGAESYNVYAFSGYKLLAKDLSGTRSLDGKPWTWSFSGLTDGIDAIVIYKTGFDAETYAPATGWTTTNGVGMTGTGYWNDDYVAGAFYQNGAGENTATVLDNLTFTATPEPSALLVLGSTLLVVCIGGRRQRSRIANQTESPEGETG